VEFDYGAESKGVKLEEVEGNEKGGWEIEMVKEGAALTKDGRSIGEMDISILIWKRQG